jgi:hypothetical protein
MSRGPTFNIDGFRSSPCSGVETERIFVARFALFL